MKFMIVSFLVLLLASLAHVASAGYLPTEEQVAMAARLFPTLGITGEGWKALQVGKTHRPGVVAYAAIGSDGSPAWGLEEWSLLENGNLHKIQWRFYPGGGDRYEQVFEPETRALIWEGPRIGFQATDPEAIRASEKCWRELMKAGYPA